MLSIVEILADVFFIIFPNLVAQKTSTARGFPCSGVILFFMQIFPTHNTAQQFSCHWHYLFPLMILRNKIFH